MATPVPDQNERGGHGGHGGHKKKGKKKVQIFFIEKNMATVATPLISVDFLHKRGWPWVGTFWPPPKNLRIDFSCENKVFFEKIENVNNKNDQQFLDFFSRIFFSSKNKYFLVWIFFTNWKIPLLSIKNTWGTVSDPQPLHLDSPSFIFPF